MSVKKHGKIQHQKDIAQALRNEIIKEKVRVDEHCFFFSELLWHIAASGVVEGLEDFNRIQEYMKN